MKNVLPVTNTCFLFDTSLDFSVDIAYDYNWYIIDWNIVHCIALHSNFLNLHYWMRFLYVQSKEQRIFQNITSNDGLESSMKAADYAIAIARKKGENNNAKLIALHVIHSEIKHVYFTYSSVDLSIKGPLGELYRMLRDRLRHGSIKFKKKPMKTTLRRREIIVNSRLILGAVVDYAEHEGVDLIVMGSRGLSGFKKLLLGSTASGVVTYAHCPVLVVNEQKYTS